MNNLTNHPDALMIATDTYNSRTADHQRYMDIEEAEKLIAEAKTNGLIAAESEEFVTAEEIRRIYNGFVDVQDEIIYVESWEYRGDYGEQILDASNMAEAIEMSMENLKYWVDNYKIDSLPFCGSIPDYYVLSCRKSDYLVANVYWEFPDPIEDCDITELYRNKQREEEDTTEEEEEDTTEEEEWKAGDSKYDAPGMHYYDFVR